MYAYCNNNPVMYVDPSGNFLISLLVSALVGAAISALSYTASEVISFAITGEWTWSWGGFFGSVIGGAIGGAISGGLNFIGGKIISSITQGTGKLTSFGKTLASKTLVKFGTFISGALTKAGSMFGENIIDKKGYSLKQILSVSTIVGSFSFLLSDGSPTSLFKDINFIRVGQKATGYYELFVTNLIDDLYEGVGANVFETIFSKLGFEYILLQFTK